MQKHLHSNLGFNHLQHQDQDLTNLWAQFSPEPECCYTKNKAY